MVSRLRINFVCVLAKLQLARYNSYVAAHSQIKVRARLM